MRERRGIHRDNERMRGVRRARREHEDIGWEEGRKTHVHGGVERWGETEGDK